jgi:thioredoxin 1
MIHVIRFSANFCQPCKMLAPEFKKLEEEFGDVKFTTIDVEDDPHMTDRYDIRTVPTVVIEKNDLNVTRLVGARPRQVYADAITDAINYGQ